MQRLGLRLTLLVALLSGAAAAQDSKAVADALVRDLVALQDHNTWMWGEDLTSTCRALDLLTRSPRRYNEVQGPFFRRAADAVAAATPSAPAQDTASLEREAWRTLALAGAVTERLQRARDAALDNVLNHPEAARGYAALLARRTFQQDAKNWPAAADDDSAEVHVLLTDTPAQIPAPALEDTAAWARWARARRLRGVPPTERPELPALGVERDLDQLLDALELTLALHGLASPDSGIAGAGESAPRETSPLLTAPRDRRAALETGLAWLDAHHDGGTFGLGASLDPRPEPGITSLCLAAAMTSADELGQSRPSWVDEGLDHLVSLQRADGSIASYGVVVYTTSVALEALVLANRPDDALVIERARDFLVRVQADEGEGYERDVDPHYGGIGYGGDERPDLSNTNIALEAAVRAGLPADSPLFAKALDFLERNQNLAEQRARSWPRDGGGLVVSGHDGGATYMPGQSPAGEEQLSPGVYTARSYGSMTFALLKSYLFCGLPRDDARVQAALRWVARNYTFETNPGFKDPAQAGDGLFYYYVAAGRALAQAAPEGLFDEQGRRLDWKQDLSAAVLRRQRQNGSWRNAASPRWYEGNPALCTAFALLALTTTR